MNNAFKRRSLLSAQDLFCLLKWPVTQPLTMCAYLYLATGRDQTQLTPQIVHCMADIETTQPIVSTANDAIIDDGEEAETKVNPSVCY